MTQIVQHKSRDHSYVLNFAETENTLSWAINPDADGEIYDVVSTNVLSYKINGAAITLPFALTGGASYAIEITKTTLGQSASITFKTRRAVTKSSVLNIPDFGLHDGRYLFAICHASQKVYKIDKSLFVKANYAGAGVFTVTPIVATIDLPVTIPNNISQYPTYSSIAYNPVDGNFYFGAGDTQRPCLNCCKIGNDNIVRDLDGVANQSTLLFSSVDAAQDMISRIFVIDYITNKAIVEANTEMIILDLTSKSTSALGINNLYKGSHNGTMFNPYEQYFVAEGDFNFQRGLNFKEGNIKPYLFNKLDGRSYTCSRNLLYRLKSYDNGGIQKDFLNNANTMTSSNISMSIDSDNQVIVVTGRLFEVGVHVLSPYSFTLYVYDGIPSETIFRGVEFTHYDNSYVLFGGNRLVGFDLAEIDPFWGYLDLPDVITNIEFNRVKI